jgi:hypothetical protein
MRFFAMLACALVSTIVGVLPCGAEQRVALIVGNSDYRFVSRLNNPADDARLMASTLHDLGFTLIGGGALIDLDKPGLDRAVQAFGLGLRGAEVGLFYYSGHGVQVRGANYIVPIDANATREADVDFQMLDANLVLRQMEAAGTRLNIVIFDACRNNPFAGRGLRATVGGLAQMQAPEGTLISYATQPGNVARDGDDGNSPYTEALATTMRQPGLDLFNTFNQVGLVVRRATGGEQQPWVSSSPISGAFYFVPQPSASLPPTSSLTPTGPPISQSLTASPEIYDPLRIVKAFYTALSAADGNTAAALMVPDKRGAGPFNEANIRSFYSSLRAPLRIESIARVSDNTVGVRYRFTRANGSICSGNATVNTIFMGGKTLIKGISANC